MNEQKTNKMASTPIKNLFWKMGLPMIISMVLQALYNVVDSIFVTNMGEQGRISKSSSYYCFSYTNFNNSSRSWNRCRTKCTIIKKFRRKEYRKSK